MAKTFIFDAYGTLFDIQSVSDVIEEAFPGRSEYITQVWRLKQLEYSWLRSLMDRYTDFWQVTREALAYTLGTLDLTADEQLLERIVESYHNLKPQPDALPALQALAGHRCAILSNGSPSMLETLVKNAGLDGYLEAVLSVDKKRVFKPDPRAYQIVEERLGVVAGDVVFVTSNGFDICGAKAFGFKAARIARMAPGTLSQELTAGPIGPKAMFKALRTQPETCGHEADYVIASLLDLVPLAKELDTAPEGRKVHF